MVAGPGRLSGYEDSDAGPVPSWVVAVAIAKESTPRWQAPWVSPVRVGGQQVAGGEGCRGRRGCRLRDEMVVNSESILSPGLKLVQVGSLRGRTVGRVGPGLVLVRPGARASGSPHQPGWVPGVRPPRGGSARGRSAERRVWVCLASPAPWPGRQMCPARGRCLPSVVGSAEKFPAFHRPWGRPPSLCPAATGEMASESAFSRRKPLGTLQVGCRGERGLVARGSASASESFQRPTTVQPQVPKPPQCKHRRG